MNPTVVDIRPPTEDAQRLWNLVLTLAAELGPDSEWSLIGGLMVQLHGFERGDDSRATADIDLLGGARRPPRMTEKIAEVLVRRGATMATPPRSNPGLGYRFEFEGETVELLGPDGLKADPATTSGLKTFQVPGGTQALRRTEVVLVSLVGAEAVAVRRPDLLGAILIKARVVAKGREEKFASDRQDLVRLLSYVDDPRALAGDLGKSEKRWLRDIEDAIGFDKPDLAELYPGPTLELAGQAFALLVR
jgi:hypothetical protein